MSPQPRTGLNSTAVDEFVTDTDHESMKIQACIIQETMLKHLDNPHESVCNGDSDHVENDVANFDYFSSEGQ